MTGSLLIFLIVNAERAVSCPSPKWGASLARCLSCLCQSQMSSPKADLTNPRGSVDMEAGRAEPEGQTELCHMAGDAWEANNSYSVCEQGRWHQLVSCQRDWGSDLYLLSYRCGPSPQSSSFSLLSSLEEASQEGVPYHCILTLNSHKYLTKRSF